MRSRLVVCCLLVACASRARANQIPFFTVDGGGAVSAGGPWSLTGTIAQPDAGLLSNGSYTLEGGFWWGSAAPTAVAEEPQVHSPRFTFHPAQPNPFNPATSIAFALASAGQVQVRIYTPRGELVATLLDEPRPAGEHRLVWRGQDERGQSVASGVYVVMVESNGERASRRIVLVR